MNSFHLLSKVFSRVRVSSMSRFYAHSWMIAIIGKEWQDSCQHMNLVVIRKLCTSNQLFCLWLTNILKYCSIS